MKHQGWLLLSLSFLCFTAVLPPALAHDSSGLSALDADTAQGFCHNRGLNHSSAGCFVLPGDLRAPPAQESPSLTGRALDTRSNDDGQADDSSDDFGGVILAFSERCICPTDWRLVQPDEQFANHFIHAKPKPPP